MAEQVQEYEFVNASGSTSVYSGTATGSTVSIPAVADKVIEKFELFNASPQTSRILQVSMDGGSTFFDIANETSYEWDPKGIKQLVIKSIGGATEYQLTINFQEFS